MAKLVEIYEQWKSTPDTEKREELALQIYEIHKNNLWSIAYLEASGTYSLINSKLKNYPDNLVSADLYQYSNIVHFWTLFKED
jgi:peptide/nickel transport system substrate-binding protein